MRASIAKEIKALKMELFCKQAEEKLRRERRQTEAAIAGNLRATNEMDEGWQERDSPAEYEIREVEFSHRENLRATLRDINEALDRIANHTFGLCVDCKKKIENKRLEINPTASRCKTCQSALEGNYHVATL